MGSLSLFQADYKRRVAALYFIEAGRSRRIGRDVRRKPKAAIVQRERHGVPAGSVAGKGMDAETALAHPQRDIRAAIPHEMREGAPPQESGALFVGKANAGIHDPD